MSSLHALLRDDYSATNPQHIDVMESEPKQIDKDAAALRDATRRGVLMRPIEGVAYLTRRHTPRLHAAV